MSALALTLLPTLAAVRVSVTGAAPNASVAVTRTDVNGVQLVRQPAGLLTDGNGELQLIDYEPALTGNVLYSVVGAPPASIVAPAVDGPVVHSIAFPTNRASSALLAWTHERAGTSQVLPVLNRRDPIVILRPLALRTGTGTLNAAGYADAAALEDVLDQSPVMLRTPCFPRLDVIAAITNVTVTPAPPTGNTNGRATARTGRRWTVTFAFTEMSARDLTLQSEAAWTIGAAADAFETIGDAGIAFATLRDYAIGPTT